MTLSFEILATTAFIISVAYIVFGLTGFGSSITAMPFLAMIYPLRFAVPVMVVLDLSAAIILAFRNFKAVDRRELFGLVPYTLVGIVFGVTVLVYAPARLLLFGLGVFVVVSAVRGLFFAAKNVKPISKTWSIPIGIVGGAFTALFGTGGPVYATYLARRIQEKAVLRATMGTLILISGISRLVAFSTAGLFGQKNLLLIAAAMIPCALCGLYAGSHLHRRLPAERVVHVLWMVLLVGGVSLVWRGIHG